MRPVLILGLLCAACAAAPAPSFGPGTRMSDCALVPDEQFDPCMKQAFANIPVAPDRPKMAPPVVRDRPAPYGIDQHDWNMAGLAVNNAVFCAGTWSNAWDISSCTSRLNRGLGID